MKVKDLIKYLKSMPKNLDVYTADHDHGTFETASSVTAVEFIDKKEMTEYDNDKSDLCFQNTPKKYVVLRT